MDALSYVDSVKTQFHDKPDDYQRFMQIMKDFRSEVYVSFLIPAHFKFLIGLVLSLDTTAVLERIIPLFNGHLSLIQGFSTFLPAGYHIACSTAVNGANAITVTTPTAIMQTTSHGPDSGPIIWSITPLHIDHANEVLGGNSLCSILFLIVR